MRRNLNFCDRFNYPAQVRDHFRKILEPIDPEKVLSVLLLGSTSRGELSYREKKEGLSLLSDYEFFIIAKGMPDRKYAGRLKDYYLGLQRKIGRGSPFFHIDFDFIPLFKLRHLSKTFFTYDLKKTGITIWGEDVKKEIAEVTLENIDLKELNETLIWRLLAVFLYTPPELLREGTLSEEKEILFKYLLSRNILDIATWLLPWEKELIPTFQKRTAFIKKHYEELGCFSFLGKDFPLFLGRCLAGKLNLEFKDTEPVNFYGEVVSCFLRAFQYLVFRTLSFKAGPEEALSVLAQKSNRFFRDRTLLRRGYDAWLALKNLKFLGRRVFGWYLTDKHGLLASAVFKTHRALLLFLSGEEEKAGKILEEAVSDAQTIVFLPLPREQTFLSRYRGLRKAIIHFMVRYFPWAAKEREHLDSLERGFYCKLKK